MRGAKDRATRGGRMTALVIVALGLTLLPACSTNDNKTLVNGVDCGLFRSDLTGTWQVTFNPDSALTANCDVATFDGNSITVNSIPTSYPGVIIDGSDSAAAFRVTGDSVANQLTGPELIGSVQADSCLALFRVWDNTDKAYIQCIGVFDPLSRKIDGGCDSADIDNPVGSPIEATCDLSSHFRVLVGIL